MQVLVGPIKSFRSWKSEHLKKEEARKNQICEELRKRVPKPLQKWFGESGKGIIMDLLENGEASRKYDSDDLVVFGYNDMTDFVPWMEKLFKCWKFAMSVESCWEQADKFRVRFIAH